MHRNEVPAKFPITIVYFEEKGCCRRFNLAAVKKDQTKVCHWGTYIHSTIANQVVRFLL